MTPLSVGFDYGVQPDPDVRGMPPIYVNGLCESTHGLGDAGSFSLLALRSKAIVQSLRRRLTEAESTDVESADGDLVGAGPRSGSAI
jgi:L-ornithine N5-oxygenase